MSKLHKLHKILKKISTHDGKKIHWADISGDGKEFIGIAKNGTIYSVTKSNIRRKQYIIETNDSAKWIAHELNGKKSA